MNLRGIVAAAVGAVNPDQSVTWMRSTGYTTSSTTGAVTPTYATQTLTAQIQPIPTDRLQHLDNLNIQGVLRQVYLYGAVATAVRKDGKGGDLLVFPEVSGGPDRTWLVEIVDEQWSDGTSAAWCRVIARLQND